MTAVGESAERVLERLGSGGAATPEELFWEVRRLLESLAVRQPVILHVDDLQWAEPMLLDLLDHIVDLSRGAPILVLCTARPELLEDRLGWAGGKLNASTVLLEPLGGAECAVWGILAESELSAGNPTAALASLRRSDRVLAEFDERSFRSTIQARLAQTHEQLADRRAAQAAIELSGELGAPEDVINYAITHAVRARFALADGDLEAAERWARSAIEHSLQTDFVVFQANARLEFAWVLSAMGRRSECASEARAAVDLFESKSDRPGSASARALLDELRSVT